MEADVDTPQILAEKDACYIPLVGYDCPINCIGLVATKFIEDIGAGQGFMIQVCPNPEMLGSRNENTDYRGDGPDVIILHRDTVPADEEYHQAVCEALEEFRS